MRMDVVSTFTRLAEIIATPPAPGTNRILSGHLGGFEALAGVPHLQEGEAAVFRVIDDKRVIVARLLSGDWRKLAAPQEERARERSATPDPEHTLRGAALARALRSGGYTLYFRHTATDLSQQDRPTFAPGDCKSQRNLSPTGRAQARRIGQAIAAMKLPVGEVLASPYCRTMETARLLAGRATPDEAVRGRASTAGGPPDYSGLGDILAQPVKRGTLRIVSGHGNGFRAVAGAPHLEEGEAAVLRPAEGSWIVVARIRAGEWEALARQ
jgi:hypothetical protein